MYICLRVVHIGVDVDECVTILLHKTYGFKPHPMTSVLHFACGADECYTGLVEFCIPQLCCTSLLFAVKHDYLTTNIMLFLLLYYL